MSYILYIRYILLTPPIHSYLKPTKILGTNGRDIIALLKTKSTRPCNTTLHKFNNNFIYGKLLVIINTLAYTC